jgi:V/A-type H+-transporting ATPase subunit B
MPDPVIYTKLDRVDGPLLALACTYGEVGFGEAVNICDKQGRLRRGRVVLVDGNRVMVETFEGTQGMSLTGCSVRFMGEPISLKLDPGMIGRRLNGLGQPVDGGPPLTGKISRNVNGNSINPVSRDYPEAFIQTGISAIDGMNALVRGQKLPIFSSSGLAHDQLAIQIARQARIRPDLHEGGHAAQQEELVVVFAAIGVKYDVAVRFAEEITGSCLSFLNLADDPAMERLLTPCMALTAAEYLAFDLGLHVLVVMTDMTNYGEAMREIATARGDVPSRKGYPGFLYSDLASIYERAGRIRGKPGSVTQIPILTMPNDDITHPVPDLTGYITEGQIVLSRDLSRQGIYPPIDVLPSLSRLMNDGVGKGLTRSDHASLMSQLYAAYARAARARVMSLIVGEADLPQADRLFLRFGEVFEQHYIAQESAEERDIEQTLEIGWRCLSQLPVDELTRLSRDEISMYETLLQEGLAGVSL